MDIAVSELVENGPCPFRQTGHELDREYLTRQFRQYRGLVAGSRPDLEDTLPSLETQCLRHERNDVGLRDRLLITYGQRVVTISRSPLVGVQKTVPFHFAEGREDTLIFDVPAYDLVRNHTLTATGKLASARPFRDRFLPKEADRVQCEDFNTREGGIDPISSSMKLGPSPAASLQVRDHKPFPNQGVWFMKIVFFVALICLLSAVVVAHDLTEVARKARARRQNVQESRSAKNVRSFTNLDLDRYHRQDAHPIPVRGPKARKAAPQRNLAKEKAYWEKEAEKHRKELARVDARIRRLEWRLADRQARRRPGERLRDDPAEKVLEQSLEAMHEEKKRIIEEFRERARRAAALPGWLR